MGICATAPAAVPTAYESDEADTFVAYRGSMLGGDTKIGAIRAEKLRGKIGNATAGRFEDIPAQAKVVVLVRPPKLASGKGSFCDKV